MTTPVMSYYENIINSDKKMQKEYRHHKWKWFYSLNAITSFTYWGYSDDIFHYKKGNLMLKKRKSNSYWNSPDEYFKPLKIKLSKEQDKMMKTVLKQINFKQQTDPCSFVNLYGGYIVGEHISCNIAYVFKYSFVPISRHDYAYFQILDDFLHKICEPFPEYNDLELLKKRIFDKEEFVIKK